MKPGTGKKVLVAMSGGVDSSVAAALLKEEGYTVVGCFMRLGEEAEQPDCGSDEVSKPSSQQGQAKVSPLDGSMASGSMALPSKASSHQGCCSLNDASDARLVAAMLDIPFYVLNFRKDFGRIIDYFVGEYNAGRTPNPCVRCNDWLKFGKLAAYARSIDADFVATGHYARIRRDRASNGANHRASKPASQQGRTDASPLDGSMALPSMASSSTLLRGVDHAKDQSYVLFGTKRDMLAHMLLPIGELEKPAVRAIARELKLPVFDKPDSQEICFVPDNDYARLVKQRSPQSVRSGEVLDRDGRVLGRHEGQQHFTIGQRRGLGIAASVPLYVLQRDPQANTITVGPRDDLLAPGLAADQTNWLIDPPTAAPISCQIKIRYNSVPVPGTVQATGPQTLVVRFAQPQSAVTPGQAVVCYDGERLLGGGWITQADRE